MKKPDNQFPMKEDPLKHNSNTEKLEISTAEIEARVIKFGQKYIDRLIELTKVRMGGIREEDAKTFSIDTFLLFGNPDLDFITNFAETWKKKASKGRRKTDSVYGLPPYGFGRAVKAKALLLSP